MRTKIYQVDAFTSAAFKGNPAGVCVLEKAQPDEWMKNVASEMNFSETAFLVPEDDGFRLRWFTPRVEVDLCGHATLASAHILWEKGFLDPGAQARFHTRSGQLNAEKDAGWIVLDFPSLPPESIPAPHELQSILQTDIVYIGKSRFDWMVEVEDEQYLRALQPDFTAINRLPARGLIVTSRSRQYDFISRFFAPAVGVNEDPVTGSVSHCIDSVLVSQIGKS